MTTTLVTMRLADMYRMHPGQDSSRVCSGCQAPVGIYPSSQRQLRRDPTIVIVCVRCAFKKNPGDVLVEPAGSIEEIMQESRDSFDVKTV
jgi:hypothetical protein